eukprot:snap_masked-scaffold_92-processed-gene-0.23-mRNA-1 protein AED:1.00 eAED:1.00 QI:0/0/0/0/1/1/2/0/276
MNIFFPIENSKLDSQEKKDIKDKIKSLVSGASGIKKENFLNFRIRTAKILFLDNCREQTNIMTLKEFEDKSYSCGFEDWEVEQMLEIYSRAGKFIRDPNFHELAFRIPSNKFSLYRIYVDKGKLNKELFNILLKEYSDKEKKYILSLALNSLVLIPVEKENDVFILPELLPELKKAKIKPSLRTDIKIVFKSLVRLAVFVKVVFLFLEDEDILESLLFKGFARIIFKNKRIIDIFLNTETEISFTLVQGNNLEWLKENVDLISKELQEVKENDVVL